MTRAFSLLLAIPLALSLASCGEQQTVEPSDRVTVIVSPSSILLLAGDTVRFTAVVKDAQGATVSGKSLQWSSSDTTVATVSGTGLVTAVSDGAATITAATDSVTGTALVTVGTETRLVWPIDCDPGGATCASWIGYPDIDEDGTAFDCGAPGYTGHQGTDINLHGWEQMDAGVDVFAAAAGEVLWVFDGKYDRCPNDAEPDCQPGELSPNSQVGYTVCTELGSYCGTGTGNCFWCFAGGNVVVIRHSGVPGVFATRYDHFRANSILVSPGETVAQGQKIGEVGSAGASSGPHLHFEVWGTGFYELADPWAGACGPNRDAPLWAFDPPWSRR